MFEFMNHGDPSNIVDCTGKHPANVLLANFYLPKVQQRAELPKILGLSASPVMKAKASTTALELVRIHRV